MKLRLTENEFFFILFVNIQKFRQQAQNQQLNYVKVQHNELSTTSLAITAAVDDSQQFNSCGIDNGRDADYSRTAGTSNGNITTNTTTTTTSCSRQQFVSKVAKQRRQVELYDVAGKVLYIFILTQPLSLVRVFTDSHLLQQQQKIRSLIIQMNANDMRSAMNLK